MEALVLQIGVVEADPNQALALVRDIIQIVTQEKALSLRVGLVRATSQVVTMTITLVLVARIVWVRTATLAPNEVVARVRQTFILLQLTVLISQKLIQIQATQSLRCLLLN